MTRVFDGSVHVAYWQAYVESPGHFFEYMGACFVGQQNGLCGAAVPGVLFLTTGLNNGEVLFAVDVLDQEPVIDDDWEDVVEVSFVTGDPALTLVGWGRGSRELISLGRSGSFRVRYSAHGLDAAHQQDTRLAEDPVLDRYLLQFWPGPPAADAIVRQSSQIARYWHEHSSQLPPLPPPGTAAHN